MKGYLEDLKVGGRPMTDKELAEHYKHLYSEVKKRNDNTTKYVRSLSSSGRGCDIYEDIKQELLRMLGEIDNE
jgi:hypothetical protein